MSAGNQAGMQDLSEDEFVPFCLKCWHQDFCCCCRLTLSPYTGKESEGLLLNNMNSHTPNDFFDLFSFFSNREILGNIVTETILHLTCFCGQEPFYGLMDELSVHMLSECRHILFPWGKNGLMEQ